MRLFVFGLGYSALHFVRTRRAHFESIAGTVRSGTKAGEISREGIAARVFGDTHIDPAIFCDLARTDALLVSVPPSDGDPVLARFGEAITEAPHLRRIVYLSTVGVYGDHGGAWVDETTPPRPSSPRNRARLDVENAWAALAASAGKKLTILRLAGIYGPGRSAFAKLRDGTARRIVKKDQVFNRIHVEDIARSIGAALTPRAFTGVVNVTDDEPAPPQDVIAYAARLLGIEPPPEIPFETAELPEMARSFYAENRRVANARLKRELGVALAFPTYREGLSALAKAEEGK